jgi:tetratricopeptide (TPR) repeat protein
VTNQIREQLQATLGSAYTLERELGGGGMSRVFVAEETALRRKVVVKVLPPELTAGVNVERFNREILVAAKLQHPHVVPVLSAGETQGLPYFTMPFVDGESLRARLSRGALPITDAISILKDVARALQYAHRQGIVHRDIKPDNVLIAEGSATVADFGIAKAISASRTAGTGATLTQVGTSIGTPAYMAPEQAAGDPDTDHRADIYSFGCMAYELLAGRPPFVETSPRKLLAAHMGEKPQAVAQLRPDTPVALAMLVMQCLEKEAADRPQQASDIVRVLETVTSGGTSPAMPGILLGGAGMFRKALAVYAIAFVAVAVLAKAAIVGIGLPDWVFPGSLVVMALGLPVVLWTGYVHRVARRAVTATPTFTPGGSPSMTARGTIATMALKAAPHVSWYKTARGGMYAFGAFVAMIAAFMGMRQFGIGPFGSLLASGRLEAKAPILMTDFTVTTGDTSLARVVSFAVRTALAQSSVISIMNQAAVADALERMERPRTARIDLPLAQGIAVRDGIKAVVDGEVTPIGTGYVLTVRLIGTDSSRVLASVQASGEGPQGLIEAADKAARELRSKVGESLRNVQNAVPLVRARTGSLEALRRYNEGALANDVENDPAKAVRPLRDAVRIDSTFAEGWRKLGVALRNLAAPRVQVDSMLTRAYQLRGRLPEGEQAAIEATYFGEGPGRNRARAIVAYQRAIELIGLRRNNLANLASSRRDFVMADSLFRGDLAADSLDVLPNQNGTVNLVSLGRLDAADSALGVLHKRFPKAPWVAFLVENVRFAQRRFDDARAVMDSLRGTVKGYYQADATRALANHALLRGEIGKWRALRAQAFTIDSSVGRAASPIVRAATELAALAVARGATAADVARLDAALAALPLRSIPDADRPDTLVARAFALAGRPDRAKTVISGFEATVRDTALRRELETPWHTVRGHIAVAEKRTADAIAEFRKGDVAPDGPVDGCPACLPLRLARAFDAAGQADSAIVNYEEYITRPTWNREVEDGDPMFLPGVHERLGQLYEARGDAAKAAQHYRAFIDLWKNADPELQPRVAEAKRRLAKLGPVEGARR